jgi:hypothetical protein
VVVAALAPEAPVVILAKAVAAGAGPEGCGLERPTLLNKSLNRTEDDSLGVSCPPNSDPD